jgi:hypothetical protein
MRWAVSSLSESGRQKFGRCNMAFFAPHISPDASTRWQPKFNERSQFLACPDERS